ncbi:hypothetical protein [Anaerotignum sp.]|uniref:hypothetical protein n=1 Tax=Anaerotignum sp. TaxID=2039241 RepID=UPI00271555CE|nr:hypothetical protein [Anaerotignum sp.]
MKGLVVFLSAGGIEKTAPGLFVLSTLFHEVTLSILERQDFKKEQFVGKIVLILRQLISIGNEIDTDVVP